MTTALRLYAINHTQTSGFDYGTAPDGLWAMMEPGLGIIVACVPVLQPVFSEIKRYVCSLKGGSKNTGLCSLRRHAVELEDERQLDQHTAEDRLYRLPTLEAPLAEKVSGTRLEEMGDTRPYAEV